MHACTHSTCTYMQWRPQRRPRAGLSGDVSSKPSVYFKINGAQRAFCRCLPFNLEKMATVSVTVFKENKVLCRGHLLRVSDVDISLFSMLQGLLSTSETSDQESMAEHLHSVSTTASEEVSLCVEL